ncbi:MAG: type II toxin-antitoxin system RelE/ParE family toxin [Alphaproteobacteria bacterium]
MEFTFQKISSSPYLGKRIDEIKVGCFKYSIGKHFIFYKILEENEIKFIRILHQRMDIENHF